MGANLLIVVASLAPQTFPQDTPTTSAAPGFAYERLQDLAQYNRVQGLSFGVGYRVPLPGAHPTAVYATVRYGLSDDRITGRVTAVRENPRGALALGGYSDIADVDPFSPGRTLANTVNALIAGHDNGDYTLASGGSASFRASVGVALELVVAARIERQRSVSAVAQSELNDVLGGTGVFPSNPPVSEGTFGATSVRLNRLGTTPWSLTADALGGAGQTTARLFGEVRRSIGSGLGITLQLKAGAATEPTPPQILFRLGGVNTVRGFEYGSLRAPAFWAVQADLTLFDGRVRPVAFLDAGQAARTSDLFSSSALVGAGAGLSLFGGLIRLDLSRPISPEQGRKLRFDLVLQGVR
jgi:hypothetical protein